MIKKILLPIVCALLLISCEATNPPKLSAGHLQVPAPIDGDIPAPVTQAPVLRTSCTRSGLMNRSVSSAWAATYIVETPHESARAGTATRADATTAAMPRPARTRRRSGGRVLLDSPTIGADDVTTLPS